ncbi:hypothetical protein F5J12DRAFT_891242 [Pisolithus orientalis]|uniref:uncharacterized protein n=1 Tax=Pisolithus orientalis TaxID=936130 RepID=UPI0022249769|nr:uncharacterized protein F5J12DRAFT_891242 [Pisolithus orientalis]KAI6010744.1 hypothetical protein F5J12DRAFT_891242 [Pisolithus orientalis]
MPKLRPLWRTPVAKKGPKPSSITQENLAKAKEHIQKVSMKHTIEDALLDIQKHLLLTLLIRTNLEAVNAHAHQEMNLETCEILLAEFKEGIWTAEYDEQIALLSGGNDSCPAKKACQYSPDWDDDLGL